MSQAPAPQKFSFDTVFDTAGDVAFQANRPKRLFPADEVVAIRQSAYAEGEAAALASVAADQAQALAVIADACRLALPKLAEVAQEHRAGAADLAMACGRAIAAAAFDRFPPAPIQAAIEALAREIDAAPKLVVSADPQLAASLQGVLDATAQSVGFTGAVQVRPDAAYGPNAFTLDFGDGSAAFDPAAASERVAQALQAALAAEGLHAEPLLPGSES